MLTKEKQAQLQALVHNATKEELAWVNGYLSGLLGESVTTALPNLAVGAPQKLTIAYGTETGNSKKLATDLVAIAKQKKLLTKLVSLDQYRLGDLVKEEYFVTVISTQGEEIPHPQPKNSMIIFIAMDSNYPN